MNARHGRLGLPRSPRGSSLLEALVALSLMAFGLLGLVALQTPLRAGVELSRQRAEALALAQGELERLRHFAAVEREAGSTAPAFADLAPVTDEPLPLADSPTAYRSTLRMAPAAPGLPRWQALRLSVHWTDRRDQAQAVSLATLVAATPPALAALPVLPASRPAQVQPYGRHPAIPAAALPEPGGTHSRLNLPGPDGAQWVFDHASGLITQTCQPPGPCTRTPRWLLQGSVAFATEHRPTAADAEQPRSPALPLAVAVQAPGLAAQVPCATERVGATRLAFACAVPVATAEAAAREGPARVHLLGLPLAQSATDAHAGRYRVCRYAAGGLGEAGAAGGAGAEGAAAARPVDGPGQAAQRWLLIRAGDGLQAWPCPADDPATPIDTTTLPAEAF